MRIVDRKTTTGAGAWFRVQGALPQLSNRTFHALVEGSGAVSATIDIEVSNDGVNVAKVLASLALTGTGIDNDALASAEPWLYVRGNVTAISGTGAQASLILGV